MPSAISVALRLCSICLRQSRKLGCAEFFFCTDSKGWNTDDRRWVTLSEVAGIWAQVSGLKRYFSARAFFFFFFEWTMEGLGIFSVGLRKTYGAHSSRAFSHSARDRVGYQAGQPFVLKS